MSDCKDNDGAHIVEACNTHTALQSRCEALRALLSKFVEIMDSDEDGGEGIFEERLERLLPEARALLEQRT